jgi:hypothetical protein
MIICYIKGHQRKVSPDILEHSGSIGPYNEPSIIPPSPQLKYGQPMYLTNQYGGNAYGQAYNQQGYGQSYIQPNNGWASSTPFAHQNGVYGAA